MFTGRSLGLFLVWLYEETLVERQDPEAIGASERQVVGREVEQTLRLLAHMICRIHVGRARATDEAASERDEDVSPEPKDIRESPRNV